MQQTQNVFSEGINTDLDDFIISNKSLRFANNCRLISTGGNSYVLTNVLGNEETFSLTNGYVPIGSCEYDGIAYIFSHNPTTGLGEIGCYPSPDYPDNSLVSDTQEVVLTDDYRPLFNFTNNGTHRSFFQTTEFEFDLLNPIIRECTARINYDYSVNLYFTDNKNPIRVINSGFRKEGDKYYLTENIYENNDFQGDINLILNSSNLTWFDLDDIGAGGQLKPGMYHYYLVYENEDGNQTQVFGESGPVQVTMNYDGSLSTSGGSTTEANGVDRSLGTTFDDTDIDTDQKVTLSVQGLDISYEYYKIIVVHSFGEDELNRICYEIDTRFPTNQNVFTHTGREATLSRNIEDVNLIYYASSSARTITSEDSRLLAANLKSTITNLDYYREFAATISLGYTNELLTSVDAAGTNGYNPTITAANGGYQHWYNTYYKLGYWGGETYAVGVQFILKNGDRTPVFPVQGKDFVENSATNNKGIVRLPHRDHNAIKMLDNNNLHILALQATVPTLTASSRDIYIQQNTVGIQFCRAERNTDIIAQGYLVPTFSVPNADMSGQWEGPWPSASAWFNTYYGSAWKVSGSDRDEYINDSSSYRKVLPLPLSQLELNYQRWSGGNESSIYNAFIDRSLADPYRFALYSPDALIDEERFSSLLADNKIGIQVQGVVSGQFKEVIDNYLPTYYKTQSINEYTSPLNNFNGQAFFIGAQQEIGNNKFSSYTLESHFNDVPGYDFAATKLSFGNYVGVHMPVDGTFLDFSNQLYTASGDINVGRYTGNGTSPYTVSEDALQDMAFMVNIYNRDLNAFFNYLDMYPNVENEAFYSIGRPYYWNEIAGVTQSIHGGDCFVGITYKKLFYSLHQNFEDRENNKVQIGRMMQIVAESNLNPYLRHQKTFDINESSGVGNRRSFYPYYQYQKKSSTVSRMSWFNFDAPINPVNAQIFEFARTYKLPDSNGYNQGYRDRLSYKRNASDDPTLPFIVNHFPARVIYSEQYATLSFEDNWRKIYPFSRQDFDLEKGEAVSIKSVSGRVILVQERGVSLLPFKERLAMSSQAGEVFMRESGVLGKYQKLLSHTYGSQHTHSVVASDNTIYGIDVRMRKIWRLEGEGVRLITEGVLDSFLSEAKAIDETNYTSDLDADGHGTQDRMTDVENYDAQLYYEQFTPLDRLKIHEKKGAINSLFVASYFDPRTKELLFCSYSNTNSNARFNLVYNEKSQKFTSFYSFQPMLMFSIGQDFYSFPQTAGQIDGWKHNIPGTFSEFYGVQYDTCFEYVINENLSIEKILHNIKIVSNNVYPSRFIVDTENQRNDRSFDFLRRMKRIGYKGGIMHLVIGVASLEKSMQLNTSLPRSRMRDLSFRVKIIYGRKAPFRIYSILNVYGISLS